MTTVEETAERITRSLTYPCYIKGKFPLQWYRSEPTELKTVLARVLPDFETKVREDRDRELARILTNTVFNHVDEEMEKKTSIKMLRDILEFLKHQESDKK